jgi:catechol 2,3-dioxygenase-like lactoylglutathione lyase family enzyme
MLSEIRMVTVGVSDLPRALRFYEQALAHRVLEQGEVPPATARFWRAQSLEALSYAILAADDSGQGRVRLVAGEPPRPHVWAGADPYASSGYFALNYRCRDLKKQLERIAAAGGQPGRPTRWQVSEQVVVQDSMNQDPDGTHLDLFFYEKGGELRGALLSEVSVLQTVAIATRALERSKRFWEALGFEELFDRVLDFPELKELLHTSEPVRIRNANLMKDGRIVPGRIEMFSYLGMEGRPEQRLAEKARPPAAGILMVSLKSTDLPSDAALIERAGGRVVGRMQGERPGFGRGEALLAEGPDGEAIELIG